MSGEAERSETTAPIVAALRQEGDAWDRAGDHYRADLLHGAADEIERRSETRPPWVKVGDTLWADEFWYSDRQSWGRWTDQVVEEIDERGAWFLVGWTAAADRIVIDALTPSRLSGLMYDRNIRGVEFWRGQS